MISSNDPNAIANIASTAVAVSSHIPVQDYEAAYFFHVYREANRYIQWHEYLKDKHYQIHPELRTLYSQLSQYIGSQVSTQDNHKLGSALERLQPYRSFIESAYKESFMVQDFNSKEMNELSLNYFNVQKRVHSLVMLYEDIDKEKLKKYPALNAIFNKVAFYHNPATYNQEELIKSLDEVLNYGKELSSVKYSSRS